LFCERVSNGTVRVLFGGSVEVFDVFVEAPVVTMV